jgi:hypothetical protein
MSPCSTRTSKSSSVPSTAAAAQVQVDAGGARIRAGDAVVDHVLLGDDALALRALQEDGVGVDERLVLLDLLGEHLEEVATALDPTVRQVVAHAAEAVVVEHHARARELLHEVEDDLAVAEHVEDHRRAERREVGGERADRHQVAGDAHELAGDDADELRPPRDLHAGELLDRHDVGPLAVDAGEVLGAVDDRDVLEVGALLGQLLLAAVQVADDRDDVLDQLAVEVTRRTPCVLGCCGPMLTTTSLKARPSTSEPSPRAVDSSMRRRASFTASSGSGVSNWSYMRVVLREVDVVFAQRVADEVVLEQDAPQVRVLVNTIRPCPTPHARASRPPPHAGDVSTSGPARGRSTEPRYVFVFQSTW